MKITKTPRLDGVIMKRAKTTAKKIKRPKPGQPVRWKGLDKKFHAARVLRVYEVDNPTGKLCDIAVTFTNPLSGAKDEAILYSVTFSKSGKAGCWSWKIKS
jgi:hypothetical protein